MSQIKVIRGKLRSKYDYPIDENLRRMKEKHNRLVQLREAMRYWGSLEGVSEEFLIDMILDHLSLYGYYTTPRDRAIHNLNMRNRFTNALQVVAQMRNEEFTTDEFRKRLFALNTNQSEYYVELSIKYLLNMGIIERLQKGSYRIMRTDMEES